MFAGYRQISIKDQIKNSMFQAVIFYPTNIKPIPTLLGEFTEIVSSDAEIMDGIFPLVVISHGGGGYNLLHRNIGIYLAQNGYIVVLPEHIGNNRSDNKLNDTIENLENRPRHLTLIIDHLLSDSTLGKCVEVSKISVIGHSLGGYTALALAGGIPWSRDQQRINVTPDQRIKSIVLLAPATAFYFPEDSLKEVTVPILMYIAEHDKITPRWQAELILDRVPDKSKVAYKIVEKAGHLSFLCPYPPHLKKESFLPSVDPEGFDRELFHNLLKEEILNFLSKNNC